MIFAVTTVLVFVVLGLVGWLLVDFSHLGGNSVPPSMVEYLIVVAVAFGLAVAAGWLAENAVHFIVWIWSLP